MHLRSNLQLPLFLVMLMLAGCATDNRGEGDGGIGGTGNTHNCEQEPENGKCRKKPKP